MTNPLKSLFLPSIPILACARIGGGGGSVGGYVRGFGEYGRMNIINILLSLYSPIPHTHAYRSECEAFA